MGQNYHLIHHLWPSIPWYRYKPAYEVIKPLLDAKGSPQSLGILNGTKDFFGFLYDLVLAFVFTHTNLPSNPINPVSQLSLIHISIATPTGAFAPLSPPHSGGRPEFEVPQNWGI